MEIDLSRTTRKLTPSAQMARASAERREVGCQRPKDDAAKKDSAFTVAEALAEFRELAVSAGGMVVGEFVQRRPQLDPATLIGKGKLQEIAGAVASSNADLVVFDHELTPSQGRNIEQAIECRVIDRTQLILDIFARHARTREGQLQVELAQLEYLLPRLSGRGVEMSQLGGGIGTRGPGETQLETDRRRIYRRIRRLQEQLESVRRVRRQQRQRREAVPVPVVALVGYTNAGKSTLFNALTEAAVVVSSRMFATLDPTLRAITLPSKRKIVLSDTVGFIRNLPHTLVSSFRATLEEVQRASLLLRVTDVTSANSREQEQQVDKVLLELEAQDKPEIRVLNKIDLLPARGDCRGLSGLRTVQVSAAQKEGIDDLRAAIDQALTADAVVSAKLRIPQREGKLLAFLEAKANIRTRRYRENSVEMEVDAPESALRHLSGYRVQSRGPLSKMQGGDRRDD